MDSWLINLLSAIGGAGIALLGKEFIEWLKRPRLEIDFEESKGEKPHIADFNDYISAATGGSGNTYRVKYLRLKVNNKRKLPAFNCEAKLEITHTDKHPVYSDSKILHWARRHDLLYTTGLDAKTPVQDIEKSYSPVDINSNNFEFLEVLKIQYHYSVTE